MTALSPISTASGTIYEARLPNGLLVLLKPDHKAPVVSVNVAYRVGSKYEQPGITGISHLLEHMMFKSTAAHPIGEFDRMLKTVGADNNAYTWLDQTVYYETIAADRAEVALELEADRMRGLALVPSEHAQEMTVVRNELDQRDDSPFTLLYEELLAVAFVAHPYRVPTIGYKDDVEAITPADLRAHYDRYYHPDNAFMVAVGDFEPQAMLEKIERHFGAIPAGGVQLPRLTREPEQAGERRFVFQRAGTVDYILIGWHIPGPLHPDSHALVVLGNILGDGRTSRLYRALVDSGLCAEAAAWASNFGHSDPFLFLCSGMIAEGVAASQVEAVYYQIIAELASSGPAEAELARAKKAARVHFIFDHDSIERQAGALVEFELMSSWRAMDSFLPGIEAVTAGDVRRVAQSYLTERNRTVGVYQSIRSKKEKPAPPAPAPQSEIIAGEQPIGVAPPQLKPVGTRVSASAVGPDVRTAASDTSATTRPDVRATADSLTAIPTDTVTTLPNGLTIVLRPAHGNPTISLHGMIRVGRIDDPPELPGLTHFAVEMLASGTEKRDKFELAALLEDNGIEMAFAPGREVFTFAARSLSEDFGIVIEALAEMLLHSTFPEAEVEKSRQQLLSELLDSMNSTRAEALNSARELLYGETHPFAGRIAGTPDSVRAIGRDELASWYRPSLSLDGAIITVVGDIEQDAALEAISAQLGAATAPARDRSALLALGAQTASVAGQRRHVPVAEKSNCSLVWIAPGVSKRDPLWPAYFVANFIFGGDFYSRLNERLRVREGLTYGSSARYVNGLAAGPLAISAQVSPAKVEPAIAAAQEEMARFATGGATQDELTLAKSYLVGNFPVQLATNAAVAGLLTDSLYLERGIDYIQRYRQVIEGVTLAQVNSLAEVYAPERFALITAGALAG